MEKQACLPRRRRRYTEEERAEVLANIVELGVTAAARRHGIPVTTVSRWHTGMRRAPENTTTGSTTSADSMSNTTKEREERGEVASAAAATTTNPVETTTGVDIAVGKKVVRRYTPSQKAQAIEHARRHGVSETSKTLGMSRFTIYEWLRKAEAAAKGEGEAITSGCAPSEIEAQRDTEILAEYERHPGLGPSQVRNQLRRKGVKVSVHTVRRVMEGGGYRPPKVERRPHDRRYEAVRPNHMWHLDFVQRHINRASTFTLILLDDCSRFVTGHGVDDAERADMVVETFERAVERRGKPEMVMHDRGSAFWSWRGISRFTKLLTELGIDQVVAKHKEHNGKVENFNGNLAKELFDAHRFYDLAEMKRRLSAHLDWYNHVRTHHALGGLLVPADRYYGRVEQVLARIEAGVGKEHDELSLRDRRLSLFSVTSENGEVVVSLMGQRLKLSQAS
jgi:putative transposase